MKKTALTICTALMLLSIQPSTGETFGTMPPDRPKRAVKPEESSRVMNMLRSRGIEMYKKYAGVESLRAEIIKEYDPKTGRLKSTSEVTTKRRDYYYKDPEVEVVSYKKDGKEMKPSKFRIMKSKPSYPVFDGHGEENYTVVLEDKVKLNGKECYRVQVTPKKETIRHFSGNIYFRTDTLETVLIEGTVAKLDFPLKFFRIDFQLASIDGVPVIRSGSVQVRVDVPIFYPDTMIVTSISVLENRLMQ